MGELEDYYVVQGIVDYDDDPLKVGRIKCTIPGVIHSSSTPEEAIPWIRCFKMGAYQTFSRPIKGQKVWVLISKTNYNEFWWFPFFETIDITQSYIEEYYNENCDVLHARHSGNGDCMMTYDDKQGYLTKIGEDHINLMPRRQYEVDCDDCRICIEGNKVYLGDKNKDTKEPAVMGTKCQIMRAKVAQALMTLAGEAGYLPWTLHLADGIRNVAGALEAQILADKTHVN